MLRISNSLTSASLSAIFTGLEGRSALKLSRPVTLKQTNTGHRTDQAQDLGRQPRASSQSHTQTRAGVTKPEHTLSHTLEQAEVPAVWFLGWILGPTTSKSSQIWRLVMKWSSKVQMRFVFFCFKSPRFANRGLRSSCSEHKARSAGVMDGKCGRNIRNRTTSGRPHPTKRQWCAPVQMAGPLNGAIVPFDASKKTVRVNY